MNNLALLCPFLLVAFQAPGMAQGPPTAGGTLGNAGGGTQPISSNSQSKPRSFKLLRGLPSLSNFTVWGMNDRREIVGQGRLTTGIRPWVGLYWSSPDAIPQTITIPGGLCVSATGIDNAGNIVGSYSLSLCSTSNLYCTAGVSGFKLSPGGTLTYPIQVTFPGALSTQINDINSAGEMVGSYWESIAGICTQKAFFRNSSGVDFNISPPGSTSSRASKITDAGRICGEMNGTAPVCSTGWILEAGGYTNVTYPGAVWTSVSGISDSRNETAGIFGTTCPFPNPPGAFLRRGDNGPFVTLTPFGPSPNNPMLVTGMNELGDIVGVSFGSLMSGAFVGLRVGELVTR